MMPCRARLFYGTEGTVREVLKDDQTILSILTGAAFPERSRFQAVILPSCHPERSRFSGEAKDLSLSNCGASANLHPDYSRLNPIHHATVRRQIDHQRILLAQLGA